MSTTDTATHPITSTVPSPMTLRTVAGAWAPLAASWLVMGLEMPVVSAVMARLADPEVNLAAYGGVVFPIALIVEAPIIMLLAATTALGKDWASYRLMHRFMMVAGGSLTLLHAALAFTPLFDLVIVALLGPPPEIVEPARLGLQIMLPWTWTIAYRRFHQGLLIRYGRSYHVSIGTTLRLFAVVATSIGAAVLFGASGIVAGTAAIAMGVSVEAAYAGWSTRPVVLGPLRSASPVTPQLTLAAFGAFYLPLALTSLLSLLVQPIGSAAIARMPEALASLAVWPVVGGLLFMLRSLGFAFNEVVVALLDRPGAYRALVRFTYLLATIVLGITALVAFTPIARLWFSVLSGLGPELTDVARIGFAFALAWPTLDVVRNLLQGVVVYGGKTRTIGTSMALFLVVSAVMLLLGVATQRFVALPYAMVSFVVATAAQVVWLWRGSLPVLRELRARGHAGAS